MMPDRAVAEPRREPAGATLLRMVDLARHAGRAVMDVYTSGSYGASDKQGKGPVTDADRASHRVIVAGLTSWSALPIVSEEGVIPDYRTRRTWREFWLVDPLDGTKEFLNRNGEFTVNIALIREGVPVAGVVLAPAQDVLYFAAEHCGSWRQRGTLPPERMYSAPPVPGTPLRVVESRSHHSAALETFLASIPVAERVQVGSSLKFCWVAEGRADVYPRLSPIMEWDVAAGDCVYRYSGTDRARSSPLCYNTPELRIPEFMIGFDSARA